MQTMGFLRIRTLCEKYPGLFSEAAIRWLIFNSEKNGLNKAIIRIGRRVLIDEETFISWIKEQGTKLKNQ